MLCLIINSNLFNLAFFDFAVIRLGKSHVDKLFIISSYNQLRKP
jgi:hypothetical protein